MKTSAGPGNVTTPPHRRERGERRGFSFSIGHYLWGLCDLSGESSSGDSGLMKFDFQVFQREAKCAILTQYFRLSGWPTDGRFARRSPACTFCRPEDERYP